MSRHQIGTDGRWVSGLYGSRPGTTSVGRNKRLSVRPGKPRVLILALDALYDRSHHPQPLIGLPNFLDEIWQNGQPIGLLSSLTADTLNRQLNRHNLKRFIRSSVSADETAERPQGPWAFTILCHQMGTHPDRAFAILDSPPAFASGFRENVGSLWVRRPASEELDNFPGARNRFERFDEAFIKTVGNWLAMP